MNAATAYARLLSLGLPVVRTSEAAAVLGISGLAASQTLRRLGVAGLVKPLRHGLVWVRQGPIDSWVAVDWIAAPYPAYASLYSALYLRGVLSQIPQTHYAVTLGRTQQVETAVGTFSLHRLAPELFGGFETLETGARLATVEKALFDLAYLAGTRSRLFARPPELELPPRLNHAELKRWIKRVSDARRRKRVQAQLEAMRVVGEPTAKKKR
jgi:predicted transcriptional regulator of viral defense system